MSRSEFAIRLSKQRWLSYKFRRSLIKKIYPAMLKDYPFTVEFFTKDSGLRFSGNIVNYIDRLVYFCGAHEKYMLSFLLGYVSQFRLVDTEDLTFMDVGANSGNHTVLMAGLVDKVLAFEPFEKVRKQLHHNLKLNRINNVTVFDYGLSNENAVKPFYAAPDSNLGAASFQQSHKRDNYYLGDLKLRKGDDVMLELKSKVQIIKIDVEGYERFVMEGLKYTLQKDRPLIIMEMTFTTRDSLGSEAAFLDLFPKNYEFYYFSKGNNNTGDYELAPYDYYMTPKLEDIIACPHERLDLLDNVNIPA